jgi:hypothetical protein
VSSGSARATLSIEEVAELCINRAAHKVGAPVGAQGDVKFVLGTNGAPSEVVVEFKPGRPA